MTAVLFPIAPTAEAALAAPIGRAGLESAARALAGAEVVFSRELSGPAFETRDLAVAAYRSRIDGPGGMVQPQDRFCELQAVMAPGKARRTVWRLCVGYWKVRGAQEIGPAPQARHARRRAESAAADKAALEAMAQQPLLPLHPQKALDIGLFEIALPENPAIIIADE